MIMVIILRLVQRIQQIINKLPILIEKMRKLRRNYQMIKILKNL